MSDLNFELGLAAYENNDFEKTFTILMPLAKAGNLEAQILIADLYFSGLGVERDVAEAAKWYRPSAEQGNPVAQNNLASCIADENPEKAIKWLIASAEQDFPFAQYALGDIYSGEIDYFPNDSVKKFRSDSLALKWYHEAAAHGDNMAFHRLGEMYANGRGVAKDEEQAVKWYLKAAKNDHELSQKVLAQAYLEGLLGLPKDPEQAEYWLKKAKSK